MIAKLIIEFQDGSLEAYSLGDKCIVLDIPKKSLGINETKDGQLKMSISGFNKGFKRITIEKHE